MRSFLILSVHASWMRPRNLVMQDQKRPHDVAFFDQTCKGISRRDFYSSSDYCAVAIGGAIAITAQSQIGAQLLLLLLTGHCTEELVISLGHGKLIEQELHSLNLTHRMQELTQYPHLLQLIRRGEQLFTTSA